METAVVEENDCEEVSEMNLDDRAEICENPHSVLKRKVQFEYNDHPLTKCARIGSSENATSDHTISSDSDSVTSDHLDSTGAATSYPGGSYVLRTDPDLTPSAVGCTVASNDVGSNSLQKAPIAEATKKPFKLHRCRICLKIFAGADFLLKHVAEKHSKESKEQTSKIPKRVPNEIVGHNFRGDHLKIHQGCCEMTERKQEFQDLDYYTNGSSVNVKKEVKENFDKELSHNDLYPEVSRENGRQVVPETSLEVLSPKNLKAIKPPRRKAIYSDDNDKLEEQRKEGEGECQEGINDNEQSEINKIRNFTTKFCKITKHKYSMSGGTSFWCEECGLRFITAESLRAHQAKNDCSGGNMDPSRPSVPPTTVPSTTITTFEESTGSDACNISKIEVKYHWCETCRLSFGTLASLRLHRFGGFCKLLSSQQSRVTSAEPSVTVASNVTFPSSERSPHPKAEDKAEVMHFSCKMCQLNFVNVENLRRHLSSGSCMLQTQRQSTPPTTLQHSNIPNKDLITNKDLLNKDLSSDYLQSKLSSSKGAQKETDIRSKNESHGTNKKEPVLILQTPKATFRIISGGTLLKRKFPGIAEGQGSSKHPKCRLQPSHSGEGLGNKQAARIKTEAETENEAECETEAWNSSKINHGPESEAFSPVKIKQEKRDIDRDPSDKLEAFPPLKFKQEKTDIDGDTSDKLYKVPVETSVRHGCHLCGMAFPTDLLLKSHMSFHGRNGSSGFVCNVCNIKFTEIEALLMHQKRENHHLTFGCYFCEKKFVGQVAVDHHIREQHKGRCVNKPRCLFCNMEFLKESDRDQHTRSHLRQLLLCEICDLGFLKQENLTKHLSTHSQDDIQCCRICAEHFGGVNELRNHMETHRISRVNSYIPGYFKDHVKFHPGTKKPYICNICNVGYSHSSMHTLISHLLVHQQQQSLYECQKCWMHFVHPNHRGKHKCLLNH